MLGSSVAGILLGIVIAPIIFLIDALTFALASYLQSNVKDLFKASNKQYGGYFKHIRTSYHYVFNHSILSRLALSYLIVVLSIGIFQAIQMYYLSKVVQLDSRMIGVILAIGSVGAVVMSFSTLKISQWLGVVKQLSLVYLYMSLDLLVIF